MQRIVVNKLNGLEKIVKDIREYFNNNEFSKYSFEINPITNAPYVLDARRNFIKYYLSHIGQFYEMKDKISEHKYL